MLMMIEMMNVMLPNVLVIHVHVNDDDDRDDDNDNDVPVHRPPHPGHRQHRPWLGVLKVSQDA